MNMGVNVSSPCDKILSFCCGRLVRAVSGNSFKGLYVLGVLNIVYMAALVPVYFAIFIAHRRANWGYAALAMTISFNGSSLSL
jgi:hypothetical protein